MESYDELRFQIKVDKALERIKTLLHNARNPQYPTEVLHQYDDKYLLVDFLTNSALAGQMNCLQELGVVDWGTLKAWSEKRSVCILFTLFHSFDRFLLRDCTYAVRLQYASQLTSTVPSSRRRREKRRAQRWSLSQNIPLVLLPRRRKYELCLSYAVHRHC